MKVHNTYSEKYLESFKTKIYQRNGLKLETPLDSQSEECGIFGVFSNENIDTYSISQFGLFALQHRGQEACGISVLKNGDIETFKEEGLVLDVFKKINQVEKFMGNAAIGHTRYTTAGDKKKYNFQPFFAENKYEKTILSIAHNGNLTNADELRENLQKEGVVFKATSDSEVILRLIQKNIKLGLSEAICATMRLVKGAYSVVGLTRDSLFAFRDPFGIRPLVMGIINEKTYVLASESVALDAVGAQYVRDILPSEILIVNQNKNSPQNTLLENKNKMRICSFEYIYFSRPDSILEGLNVYKIREKSGEKIWEQSPVNADLVIGVPDSGVPAAIGFSKASGIPFLPVLIKNRYVGRSFIIPSQEMRERVVNLKLNPIPSAIKNKRVVVIDDSIVRGTTSKYLVRILRESGAKEIHFRSVSPPIISPCYLGIDTPSTQDLISAHRETDELKEYLNVDSLEFLSLENLKKLLGSTNYCFGCFTGIYPLPK